jgi:hypothetical protein
MVLKEIGFRERRQRETCAKRRKTGDAVRVLWKLNERKQ